MNTGEGFQSKETSTAPSGDRRKAARTTSYSDPQNSMENGGKTPHDLAGRTRSQMSMSKAKASGRVTSRNGLLSTLGLGVGTLEPDTFGDGS